MAGKIIPFGYASQGSEQRLAALMENEQTLLVDIRSKPYSQRPQWQGETLKAAWGKRYRPIWEFGNRNYNNNLPIELAAPYTGWKIVKPWLEAGHDLVLMCACKDFASCHRADVSRYIMDKMPEVEIVMEVSSDGIDESTLRAQNIPYVPPELDNAYELMQQIAKAEAAKARAKVPVDYWTRDADWKAKIVSDVKSKY